MLENLGINLERKLGRGQVYFREAYKKKVAIIKYRTGKLVNCLSYSAREDSSTCRNGHETPMFKEGEACEVSDTFTDRSVWFRGSKTTIKQDTYRRRT